METDFADIGSGSTINDRQRLFIRYFTAILIDLIVLNLFAEYWDLVSVDGFTISLLAAILLQILLRLTLAIEHKVGEFFKARPSAVAKVLRILCAWLLLFGSKFAILAALDFVFGDQLVFSGPLHGVVAFIVVVIAMIAAELALVRLFQKLG